MDVDEQDVRDGEAMASSIRRAVIASGDERLVRIVKQLPEESWARLKKLMNDD